MKALEKIMSNIDMLKLLEHYQFDTKYINGDFLRSRCKIHGGDNKSAFVINLTTGMWFCHTGDCGGGDLAELVIKMEGYEGDSAFPASLKFLADFFDVDISNLEVEERKAQYKKDLERFIRLVKSRKKEEIKEYSPNAHMHNLTSFKGFKLETIQHFGMKFIKEIELISREGNAYTLHNRLYFPIYQDGKQIGMSLRRTNSNDNPKWLHLPYDLKTGNILYNYDEVRGKEEIIICEGITDVWAFREIGLHAVCTFSANITEEQYRLLMKTGADIVIAYDGDIAGRKAILKATNMFKNKANLSIINFNDGEDPENITREELMSRYGESKNIRY